LPTYDAAFEAIDKSIQQLFARWKVYNQLFNSGNKNIAPLNQSGSYVFFTLQRLLLDDAILALSRLTDESTNARQSNASLKYLVKNATLMPENASKAKALLLELEQHVANVRVHRNKAVGHADLEHAVGFKVLPDISYTELESAMSTMQELMLLLGTSSIRRVGGYEPIIAFGTDGNALLAKLRKAVDG
jgi:hypothetical protein